MTASVSLYHVLDDASIQGKRIWQRQRNVEKEGGRDGEIEGEGEPECQHSQRDRDIQSIYCLLSDIKPENNTTSTGVSDIVSPSKGMLHLYMYHTIM